MQGGQRRDFVVLRIVLGIACVAAVGLIAAPVALANSPAGDQYGSALPGGGNGGSSSSSSGGSQGTIPVAPDSSSRGTQATGGSTDSSGTNTKANSTDTNSKGGSSQHGDKANHKAGSGGPSSVKVSNSDQSVPQIATDSAGDSWLPFFIGGMLALACAAAALVFFRNRRRTASG